MSKEIASLTSVHQRLNLGGSEFLLSPLSLDAIGKITRHFASRDMSYAKGIDSILEDNDVNSALEFIHCLIVDDNPMDIDQFKKLANKHLRASELSMLLSNTFEDAQPDFSVTEERPSKKKALVGWAMIIFAMMGMTHTLILLADYISALIHSYL